MNPNQYTMAIPGYGTLGHLEGPRLFGLSHGLQVTYVPFQGLAPALTSTVGGHMTILFGPIALVALNLKDGHLRALAVEGAKRSPFLAMSRPSRSRHHQSRERIRYGSVGPGRNAGRHYPISAGSNRSNCGPP